MSACTHAMVEGINAKLAEIGEVAWPNEKVASEVCYEISQRLDGPDFLPEGGLSKESAVMIANLIKEANVACIEDGGVDDATARGYIAKSAAAARDLETLASDVAGNCMLKAAEDTLLHDAGDSGENTLSAAAANGDPLAKLDLKNRPEGSYNAGRGNTAMPEDVGQVGQTMPHDGAPSMGAVSNSLDIKMATLRNVIDAVKTAGKKSVVDNLKDAVGSAKASGRAAYDATKKKGGGAARAASKSGVGAAIGAGAGGLAAGGAAGFLGSEAMKKKEAQEKIAAKKTPSGKATAGALGFLGKNKAAIGAGAAGLAAGAAGGVAASRMGKDKEKTASYESVVMRGFLKAAAEHYRDDGLRQLKVASPDQLDPDQLRMLADYIEQNIQAEGNNVDLGQMDPDLLAALHGQGQGAMEEEGLDEEQEGAQGGAPQMPPQMKGASASVLERIKRAAEGGPAGETGDNTLSAAASHDAVAKLDKKNRPEGSYDAGLGQTTLPNEGQVGHAEVVAPSESPKNTMTTELKSASLTAAQRSYVEKLDKMATIYGDQLPTTLNRVEKVAALKSLAEMAPAERSGFLAALRS